MHRPSTVRIPELTVVLAAETDMASSDRLADSLADALATKPAVLVLDGSQVSFMDSSGLAVLIAMANRAAANGTAVRLVSPSARLLNLLEITGTGKTVGYESDRSDPVGASRVVTL